MECTQRRTFGNELSVNFGGGLPFNLGKDHHPLSYVLPFHSLQSERGRLTGRYCGHAYPLALNGSDSCLGELTKGVRPNEHVVALMRHA